MLFSYSDCGLGSQIAEASLEARVSRSPSFKYPYRLLETFAYKTLDMRSVIAYININFIPYGVNLSTTWDTDESGVRSCKLLDNEGNIKETKTRKDRGRRVRYKKETAVGRKVRSLF